MTKHLMKDFEAVSAKEWRQKIQVDLKGADYESLITHTPEGIDIKPFYHQEDLLDKPSVASPQEWDIVEKLMVSDVNQSIKNIEHILSKGSEGLWLVIANETVNLTEIFKKLDLSATPVYVEFQFLNPKYILAFAEFLKGEKHQVRIGIDPISELAATGNWYHSLKNDQEALAAVLKNTTELPINISIDTSTYQNAGANMVQQLAYALAHANEYLNQHTEALKTQKLIFKVALGSNYFFEIAKLKALRQLYATLAAAYELPEEIEILTYPSDRNKTIYDYNVNLLRTTTECMSAILGGSDFICNLAYDKIFHEENEFGSRIARNQLLILKNESYFDKVSNPTDGAYYIEDITQQLSEKALALFKSIEKGGGFLVQLKEGIIQRKIKEAAQKEQEEFNSGETILVGTNKYENLEDKMKNDLEHSPFLEKRERKTLLPPVIKRRLAEAIEQERLKKE
ncbi:methylmalonyl-CoA mutase subunit beta [Mesonia sp. MT50]|uniref:Methylmalonyl-CoA mutase subunit beta n=1 Tax=Mesonia profundi TaxID=3070998 RepID=A0ABU0ZYD4_9FLAO|nr:methylmalonyl-CoA mutase subunit beta [Mesonia profundi]MDQ7916474.1 methylmalonyl-CoA mutase subunit beta [Mesonia profundi]